MQTETKPISNVGMGCTDYLDLKVIPSYHCSMNCSYCYNKSIYNTYKEDIKTLLTNLSDTLMRNDRAVIVELIGGEPLSSHSYPITKTILEYLNSLSNGNIKLILQTGSHNIGKIQELIPKIDGLSYSIDVSSSPKALNIDRLEKITDCCDRYGVAVQIQTILSPIDTLDDVCRLTELCSSYGANWIGVCYPQYLSYDINSLNRQIDIYYRLIKKINNFKNISIGGTVIECVINLLNGWAYKSFCTCGEDCLTIQPDGHISPCLYLKPDEFISIDDFVRAKHLRERKLREGNCSECNLWDICYGGCMVHAKFLTGDFNSNDGEFCYIMRSLINMIHSDNSI